METVPTGGLTNAESNEIEASVSDWFERQAARGPERVAVKDGARQVTYAALNAAANRAARVVLEHPTDQSGQVGVLYSDKPAALAAMLGVLKSGRTYVPLDPAYPAARTAFMLDDSQARLILCDRANALRAQELAGDILAVLDTEEFEGNLHSENPGLAVSPDSNAYILYTSGSTGQPKGVVQTHRNLLHFVRSYCRGLKITAADRLSFFISFSFSASLMDVYGALLNGATLLPFDLKSQGLAHLADWLLREEISVYHSVPTVFRNLLSGLPPDFRFPCIRAIDLGGEPVYMQDVELFKRHFNPPCVLVNHLAFTEASVAARCFIRHEDQAETAGPRVPVGSPAEGVTIHLLDEAGREIADGETGEIAVESRFLSPGYWRRPDLTAAAFTSCAADPTPRLYRSGDLGRRLPDGRLEHLGRRDARVKVRGHSVEVAEIEQALLRLDSIREAAVAARDDESGEPRLVAYVVPSGLSLPSDEALRDRLRADLPAYMIPARFVTLAALPLTATGKLDRRALPAPEVPRESRENSAVRPAASAIEATLAEIWQTVLGQARVDPDDDFFARGGDSLLAFRMLLDLEKTLGRRLPPSVLVEAPTHRRLAAILGPASAPPAAAPCLVPLQPLGRKPPLFLVPPAAKTVLIFRDLAQRLGDDQPLYSFQHLGMDGLRAPHRRVETMAAHYVQALRAIQPHGPYHIGGMCFGGIVALEMALQLQECGEEVASLLILDTRFVPRSAAPIDEGPRPSRHILANVWSHIRAGTVGAAVRTRLKLRPALQPEPQSHQETETECLAPPPIAAAAADADDGGVNHVMQAHSDARSRYLARVFRGQVTLFHTAAAEGHDDFIRNWSALSTRPLELIPLAGVHRRGPDSFVREPQVAELAEKLQSCLAQSGAAQPARAAA